MSERGGMWEKFANFSWGKKEDKKPKEEEPKYTLTGQPANEAARRVEAAKKAAEGKPAGGEKKTSTTFVNSERSRVDVPVAQAVQMKSKEEAQAWVQEQNKKAAAERKSSDIVDADFYDAGERAARSEKQPETGFTRTGEGTGPEYYGPQRKQKKSEQPAGERKLIEAGEQKGYGPQEVQKYEPVIDVPNNQSRARVKGYIESGQSQEVVKYDPHREVVKPEPVPEPVPVPKKPEEEEKFELRVERVQLADINAIVESYAQRVAEKKLHERKEKSSIFTKWVVRLAEDGYYKKYFDEAKQEIMKNHNLLSQIETHFLKKSEGVPLRADQADIHYEILDKVIESFDKKLLEERSTEVKAEHIRNMDVDLETGRLFADFAMGKIADRTEFDRQVEQRIVPKVPGAKDGERMYASNLYKLAEQYRDEIKGKLQAVGKEMGAEQEAYVRKFFEKTLRLDIQLGEKNRDLAQRLPGQSMKGYEKWVDMTQNGFFNGNSKIGRAIGRFIANPVTYAAVGGIASRGILRAAGIGVAGALTFGSASAVIIGSGIGAGIYMGWRASRERRRDIMRREQEATLGERNRETHDQLEARGLITHLESLAAKQQPLTEEEKQQVAEIRARLRLQTDKKVDLIRVSKEEGQKYGTKLNAETDLRAALDKFWQAKQGEFAGANAAERQRAYDRLVGNAESKLLPEIEKVNKEVADEIRKRGIKVGLLGGAAAAVMTGVMGGYVTKGFESVHDWLADHGYLGAGTAHWGGPNKVTYIEELGHKAGFGHHNADVYRGSLQDQASAFLHGHTNLNFPPGYHVNDMMDHGQHYINITGPDGHIVPGAEHIAVGPDGKILDPDAFDALRDQGWQIDQVPGIPGSSGGAAGHPWNLSKVHRVDWHDEPGVHYSTIHHREIMYEGKQQELFLRDTGAGVKADVHMMAKNLIDNVQHKFGEFGTNPDSSVDTKLSGLEAKLMEWYNHGGIDEVQSHLKINMIPNADANVHNMGEFTMGAHNGEIDLSSYTSALKAPGTSLHDGNLGVYRMEVGIDDGGSWHVLATGSGHDAVVSGGAAVPGAPDMVFGRPPIGEALEYPAPLAGYRRETDKNADKNRQARLDKLRPEPEKPKNPNTSDVKKDTDNTTDGGNNEGVKNGPKNGPKGLDGSGGGEKIATLGNGTENNNDQPKKLEYWQLPNWDQIYKEGFYPKLEKEKTPQEKSFENLKAKLDANDLTEADIDKAAADFKADKVAILIACLEAKKVDYQEQEKKTTNGIENQHTQVEYGNSRDKILWKLLKRAMAEAKGMEAAGQQDEENNTAEQADSDITEPGRESTRDKNELTTRGFVEKLNGQFDKFKFRLNRSAEDAFKRMSKNERQQALDNIITGFKELHKKLGKPSRNNLAVEITTSGKISIKGNRGEVKGLYIPLNSKPEVIVKDISGFFGRSSEKVSGRAESSRTESKPENKTEVPDLAESLSGKFGRIDVQVTGDGQNEFAKLSPAVQKKNIESLKAALGRINEKLGERNVKGKIKIEIGKGYRHAKGEFGIPGTATGTGAENNFNSHIDEIAPVEKRAAAKKAPEKKKEEKGAERGPKKKVSNQKRRPEARRKSSSGPRR